jgi:F420-dependent oxidoreductase-like protein
MGVMRIGLQVPDFTWPGSPQTLGPLLRRVAVDAEQAGMSSFWVMDHFFQIATVGPPEHEMLESYTTLGNVAAVTDKIMLGAMVTGVTYRHPGLLVKTVTTLDVLSGGRACLGIGAAWNEQEHLGLGVPFPSVSERFERLEETLRIARQMWSGDEKPFLGRHYQLERPLNSPPALRRPHPPILIGGTGEQKTLRMVAQYADACNIFDIGLEGISHKLDVLRNHCERLGRDYDTIAKTSLGSVLLAGDGREGSQSIEQFVHHLGELAGIGIDECIVSLRNVSEADAFEPVSEVVRQVSSITPAGR